MFKGIKIKGKPIEQYVEEKKIEKLSEPTELEKFVHLAAKR